MSRRDIDLAVQLIADRLPHLKQPRRLNPRAFVACHRVLGQYCLITDSLRLNARYLDYLDDMQALELLDTLLHELLHSNSGLLRLVRDSFRPHSDIWHEAACLRDSLADEFLARRGANGGEI